VVVVEFPKLYVNDVEVLVAEKVRVAVDIGFSVNILEAL